MRELPDPALFERWWKDADVRQVVHAAVRAAARRYRWIDAPSFLSHAMEALWLLSDKAVPEDRPYAFVKACVWRKFRDLLRANRAWRDVDTYDRLDWAPLERLGRVRFCSGYPRVLLREVLEFMEALGDGAGEDLLDEALGTPQAEIAGRRGVTPGRVSQRQRRSRERLRAFVGE